MNHLSLIISSIFLIFFLFQCKCDLPKILKNSDKTKMHIVSYTRIDTEEKQKFVAENFQLIDGVMSSETRMEEYKKVKEINPEIVFIGYRDIIGNHPHYSNYPEIDTHEDWFIHDTNGRRLRNHEYGFYLMDIGNSDYSEYIGKYLRDEIDESNLWNGIFGDDVWGKIYEERWKSEIIDESCVVGSDGLTINFVYSIYQGSWVSEFVEVKQNGISLEISEIHSNYVILKSPVSSGSSVTVTYVADEDTFSIDSSHGANWINNMKQHLEIIKTELGDDNLLIVNDGIESDYSGLSYIDGKMTESFINGKIENDVYTFDLKYNLFYRYLNDLVANRNKIYMATSRIEDETLDSPNYAELTNQQLMFCYCTYLLGSGDYSNFYFANFSYSEISYYSIFNEEIGLPINEYYTIFNDYTNKDQESFDPATFININTYFDGSLNGWENSGSDCAISNDFSVFKSSPSSIKVSYDGITCRRGKKQILDDLGILLKTNTYYTLSGYIKTQDYSGGDARIYVELRNQETYKIGYLDDYENFSSDWTFFSITFQTESTLPEYARVSFYANEMTSGTVWFDNVILQEGNIDRKEMKVTARDFSDSKILVNHLDSEASFDLEEYYYLLDGRRIKTIEMKPFTGVILKRTNPDSSEEFGMVQWIIIFSSIFVGVVVFFVVLLIIVSIIICILLKTKKKKNSDLEMF